jgi:hypothetical protein
MPRCELETEGPEVIPPGRKPTTRIEGTGPYFTHHPRLGIYGTLDEMCDPVTLRQATLFALLMALSNFGGDVGSYLGVGLIQTFGITRHDYTHFPHLVRWRSTRPHLPDGSISASFAVYFMLSASYFSYQSVVCH